MAAATGDRNGQRSEGRLKKFKVKEAVTLVKGVMVAFSAGYLTNIAHGTASLRFAGVTAEGKDNSGGGDGDLECLLERSGEFEFVYNGGDAAQALVGMWAYAVDNQTVDGDPGAVTTQYPVGVIVQVESPTKVRVQIDGFGCRPPEPGSASAALTALTDSTAGTANTTLQALADGTTYANDVAAIRNNFADLAAYCNSLRAVLVAQGLVAS